MRHHHTYCTHALAILCSPLGAALYAADPGIALARCRELAAELDRADPASASPVVAPPGLLAGWAQLCADADRRALSAHEAVERIYPAPAGPEDDGRGELREALEALAGPSPPPVRLALALRALARATRAGGARLVVDGRTGGRARWRVVGVPASPLGPGLSRG